MGAGPGAIVGNSVYGHGGMLAVFGQEGVLLRDEVL